MVEMMPNIKIEIKNDVNMTPVDDGDVEDDNSMSVDDEDVNVILQSGRIEQKTTDVHPASMNLADDHHKKLHQRAKRFQLGLNDEELHRLRDSLGITHDNEYKVRFEAIHMRGIEQMNAVDISEYFMDYSPVAIEWIDERSCNIVWHDKHTPARALHFLSKPIRDMPVRDTNTYSELIETAQGISMNEIKENVNKWNCNNNRLHSAEDLVDISEISSTIPPGYWRLAKKHSKASCLLVRFCLKTDKKHSKLDVLTHSKFQHQKQIESIFNRNKDMLKDHDNPWSALARNWDEDEQFREKERSIVKHDENVFSKNSSLGIRLGTKRKSDPRDKDIRKEKTVRMKMYADEEEEKVKRQHLLKKISRQFKDITEETEPSSDLRSVLNKSHRSTVIKEERPQEVFDLGTTLKNRSRDMVFEIKGEPKCNNVIKSYSYPSDDKLDRYHEKDLGFEHSSNVKAKSKVAVVVKTARKPIVRSAIASTIWSRVDDKIDGTLDYSEHQESSSEESVEEEKPHRFRSIASRPGFSSMGISGVLNCKSPLKIEISNDHFKK